MKFGALFLLCAGLCGQTVPQLLSTMSGTTQYRESVVSPDGHWLSWITGLSDTEIWLLDLSKPGAVARRIQNGHGVAFSPDSKYITFLSDIEQKDQLQLYTTSGGWHRRAPSPDESQRVSRHTALVARRPHHSPALYRRMPRV